MEGSKTRDDRPASERIDEYIARLGEWRAVRFYAAAGWANRGALPSGEILF